MRKLLLFFVMLFVSVGTWAAEFTWTSDDGQYSITATNVQIGSSSTYQKLVVSGPGALEAFVEATKGDSNNALMGVGGNSDRFDLIIEGEMNTNDFSALNSDDAGRWGTFTSLNLSNVTGIDFETITSSDMKMSGLKYLKLPSNMNDQDKMKQLNANNPNLGVVISVEKDTYTGTVTENGQTVEKKYNTAHIHSFEANSLEGACTAFKDADINGGYNGFVSLKDSKNVSMSGVFGDTDLAGRFNNPAIWDFTGAKFEDCTATVPSLEYYNYDDPFQEHGQVTTTSSTNAFFYFSAYAPSVVEIKLPDDEDMTHLPVQCLSKLAQLNAENYKLLYGSDSFDSNKVSDQSVPIETLVIPNCYTDLDAECGKWAYIRHLVVGSGLKRVHGGAFLKCDYLEDLDFGAGLDGCWLGDQAFTECKSMKHIALSEGIVSLGASCFENSQHLESIRLPQSLINMGNSCFKNCLALNSITIPENVEKIGKGAFQLCPFTDIYLTTTDPTKIPEIWTAGTSFQNKDGNSTFYSPDFDGNNGIPNQASEIPSMSWEEAAQWYYVRANGIPVLHYPKELAEKVRAEISSTYGGHTNDTPAYGLPLQSDRPKRANIPGAYLGSDGTGVSSQDGWAQLMLMKEFTTDPGGDVYTKQYEDVWYTMCFPFDLTDEQLAAAFNETFNIVDFSGVEIKEADEGAGTPKKLVLHFNNVAKTYYRDNKGNEYEVIGREVDPVSKFSYNIYKRDGVEYHHSQVSDLLSTNKTKTFAPGSSIAESNANKANAIIIDGVLATAGHPYMIHPAIGTSIGNPKRCDFSGVSWKPMTQWASIFDAQKRTVDLGVPMGDQSTGEPDADNFFQAEYSDYAGQTYTFIGNAVEYRDGAQQVIGDEPQVPEKPVEPVAPPMPTETLTKPTETIPAPTPLTAEELELISKLTDGNDQYNRGPWYGISELITANFKDNSPQWNAYVSQFHIFNSLLSAHGYNFYNASDGPDAEEAFNWCKETFNKNISYASDYAVYQANKALWDAYNANQAAWNAYNTYNPTTAQEQYEADLAEYDRLKGLHDTWEANAKGWLTYIPKNAYFLGRRGTALPKYYREVADDPAEGQASTRSGGVWTQFTAIVIPNDAAVAGIESELDGKTASSKGFDMAFDESFLGNVIEQDDVVTLIEKAQEEGAKVEYMDIVVSINGQVVRRGTTSLEGLPRGMYIINGKKYFVK